MGRTGRDALRPSCHHVLGKAQGYWMRFYWSPVRMVIRNHQIRALILWKVTPTGKTANSSQTQAKREPKNQKVLGAGDLQS